MTDKNEETQAREPIHRALIGFLLEEILVPLKKYFVTSMRLIAHPGRFAGEIVDGRIGVRDSLKYYLIATAIATSVAALLEVETLDLGLARYLLRRRGVPRLRRQYPRSSPP